MHLLAATPGQISDGSEPIDPNQSPADIVFISAADSELAAMAGARRALQFDKSLRLAHLSWFLHPFSTDLYINNTASKSKLVIIRALGGEAYWGHLLEQMSARLRLAGVGLAVLPGDDKMDTALLNLSSIDTQDWHMLWNYLLEGGPVNMCRFLEKAASILAGTPAPPAATPLLRAGLYWPGHQGVLAPEDLQALWHSNAPVVGLVFYRAYLQGGGLEPINQIIQSLLARNLNPLPIFVASLKDPVSVETLNELFARFPPSIVLNTTGFALSTPEASPVLAQRPPTVLDKPGSVVLQVILSGQSYAQWEGQTSGLSARDIAMNVALPEIDGRILSRAVSFKVDAYFDEETQCAIAGYEGVEDRIAFVCDLAQNWVRLAQAAPNQRRVALVMANYPNKDGRLANGVGLDTPASVIGLMRLLADAEYHVCDIPENGDALIQALLRGPTNWLTDRVSRQGGVSYPLDDYHAHYQTLPASMRQEIEKRWGAPDSDPFVKNGAFCLSFLEYGNLVVGLQPARGYNIDPEETYHAPDLVPPHGYLAFYFWMRHSFAAHACVHMGKHGNLEWLPGKAVALSELCFPDAVFGPLPHIYPFIVNDPGEGTQAKRRTQGVIVDHLTPPLTRAETYGVLRDLEGLVDEYYQAAGIDGRRVEYLRKKILALMSSSGVADDLNFAPDLDADSRLSRLDTWLCELKERQIRDGLHIFGQSPDGRLARDLTIALARVPRGDGKAENASLMRAIAEDLELEFDPLDCQMGAPYLGPKPDILKPSIGIWRSLGDTVERIETLAMVLVEGKTPPPGAASVRVLQEIQETIAPAVELSGKSEAHGLLTALAGRFLPPGPSGAPTRGRLDVLPTGRNFFSVDSRSIPTRAAWALGWKSASLLIERFVQDQGEWPKTMALSAWGTSNMRTGGDDIAQALALIGVRPVWDKLSARVTGFEIIPLSALGRPRVDVTLRISGFFRDAFPAQVDLFASAAKAVIERDEPCDQNPARARFFEEHKILGEEQASFRVFGSKPGAYGAGLQAMLDESLWKTPEDLADAYLGWGGYAYGVGKNGMPAEDVFSTRLKKTQAVVQNQDNHEHDILDSDDYYQFEGGLAATISHLRGESPEIYHNDHTRPERPVIRTLDEEMARVVRARAVNPKWLAGVMRHGYKGAFEIAATVDYLFAFAATTGAVRRHHFDLLAQAYLEDDKVRNFLAEHNVSALKEIAQRFQEAIDRGMWQPRSNSISELLAELVQR